jgi:hypothetical protein
MARFASIPHHQLDKQLTPLGAGIVRMLLCELACGCAAVAYEVLYEELIKYSGVKV